MGQPSPRSTIDVVGVLVKVLGTLDEATLRAVEGELQWVRLRGGETLFRQGDPGDSLYVLISGRLRVFVAGEEGEQAVAEVKRGESVGEMGVITGEERSATVRAIRDSELVRFSKDAFDRIVATNPQAMMQVTRRIITRLREKTREPGALRSMATVAVVPVSKNVPVSEFSKSLARALGTIGKTVHLTRKDYDRLIADTGGTALSDAAAMKVQTWLDEQETTHDYVIYEAAPFVSPWTRRCIRQADCILLVGAVGDPPGLSDLESEPRGAVTAHAREELVLVCRKRGETPFGASEWLKPRKVDAFHNVHIESRPDFERLARLLTGRAVGLVLGGGGARGFAHVGVIRALREAGIPIDLVGGTSMGAFIAAQCALGWDYETMMRANRKAWIESDPLKDKTLPIVSLLAGRKLDTMLKSLFGDARIEDLWLDYFCVSANLTLAEAIVHQDGSLWRGVRASMAIPGVAPPVVDRGNLIVDGGVLNNLPGDLMRKISGGTVIAVDVSPRKDLAIDPSYTATPSPGQILWSRLRRKPINVPNLLAIMMRTMMLSSVQSANVVQKDVDLYIRPPVDGFGIFEWESLEKLADAGYRHALKQVEEWKRRPPA